MNKDELNEKVFDQFLKYAAEQSIDKMAQKFPSDEELKRTITFSPEFEKRMQDFFKKAKRKDMAEANRKKLIKIVVPAAVFIVICFTVVSNVEALRVPILNFFDNISKQSTSIEIQDNQDYYSAFSDQIKGLYLPEYIPATYKIKSIDKASNIYTVHFENDSGGYIDFSSLKSGSFAGIDSESADSEKLTVNGQSAQLFIKNNLTTLVFEYDQNAFMVDGILPESELIKIAESIKYRK